MSEGPEFAGTRHPSADQPKSVSANFGLFLALLVLASSCPTWSQSTPSATTLPPVDVTGYKSVPKTDLSNDPAANPASVTVIDYPDDKRRNTRDYGDLLKPVTGVSANSFDQGGVGYGLTLRGYSERSNGSNAAYSIDGVPVNLPAHVSSNGYGDLNPLIPNLVDRIVLTRGPFDVRFGSPALAGSFDITTLDTPPSGATLTGGNFGLGRGFAVYAAGSGDVTGYGSLLGSTSQGYRDNSNFKQINTFNKILFPLLGGTGSVRLQVYSNDFGAPSYIRRTFVENGTLNPRAAVNPTDGGNTDLQNLVFNYKQKSDQPFTATAYVVHVDHDRFATRTFTVPSDPDKAGQFLTHDERVYYGGTLGKYSRWDLPNGMSADLLAGIGVRSDDVTSRQYSSIRRNPVTATANVDFTQTDAFGYLQVDFKPVSWIKLLGGIRYDQLYWDIKDNTRQKFVSPNDGVSSPKAGISIAAGQGLDFFANYGQGFREPSAITELPLNQNAPISKLATKEIGVQYNSSGGIWHLLADVYRTTFTNELQGQPAPLPPIALGPSRRDGFDVEGRVRAYQDPGRVLWLWANYSKVNGELVGRVTGTSIPDVAKYLFKYGFDLALTLPGRDATHGITFSASQLWEGPKPLNTLNTVTTRTFSRIDTNLVYTNSNWKGFSAFIGAIVYPDRRLEETAFLFENTATFIGNVGVSPKAPLTVQAGVHIPFQF